MIWLFAWRLSRWLPVSVMAFIIKRVTPVALRRGAIPVEHLKRNLAAVLGELPAEQMDALVHTNVRSYARYWREVFELSRPRGLRLLRQVVVHHADVLRQAAARGHGVVLALPHMANWDLAGAWAAQHYRVTTVAEQVSPRQLYERFCTMREGVGMRVIPLGSGLETLTLLRQTLEAQQVVALVADRVVTGAAGVPVRFADEQAVLPAGPATLAYQTGAALVPVDLHYVDQQMHVCFLPPVSVDQGRPRREEVARVTQVLADVFVDVVRAHPQDWRALQPVVTHTPPSPELQRQDGS